MADIQGKHSASRAQDRRPRAHASTKTKAPPKRQSSSKSKAKKRRPFPRLPPPKIIKRGKTTIRRYDRREFHRFEEVQGKTVDYAEVFTSGDFHSIAIRFQDKTLLHFTIDPGFLLETQYADTKTGDWRIRKRWPLIHSQTLRT
jgi:hypothetical protein